MVEMETIWIWKCVSEYIIMVIIKMDGLEFGYVSRELCPSLFILVSNNQKSIIVVWGREGNRMFDERWGGKSI